LSTKVPTKGVLTKLFKYDRIAPIISDLCGEKDVFARFTESITL